MDKELIVNSARGAVDEVFGTMIGLAAAPGSVYTEDLPKAQGEGVVTLIGLTGPWIGAGSISCTPELACKLSSALLMDEFTSINKDVLDAMAEITNMVFGNVKTVLETQLGPMGLSIPTVVFGRNFATNSAGQVWSVIPYEVESETMDVKICLSPQSEGAKSAGALNLRTRYK